MASIKVNNTIFNTCANQCFNVWFNNNADYQKITKSIDPGRKIYFFSKPE